MRIILTNAFSVNMLPGDCANLNFERLHDVCNLENVGTITENAIGHPDTDRVVRNILNGYGVEVPEGKRSNVVFPTPEADVLLVAQYRGPRLPEGATELPAGAELEFWLVDRSFDLSEEDYMNGCRR